MISPDPIRRFAALFDRGEFYRAHEVLAGPWRANKSTTYKALIQTAAAFIHLHRGNCTGATRLLNRASRNLSRIGDRPCFVDAVRLRAKLDQFSRTVEERAAQTGGAGYAVHRLHFSDFLYTEDATIK